MAAMADFFAGIPVSDFSRSLTWHEQLWGGAPSFFPHETEAVWELGAHRFVYVVERPEHAGHALHTLFVEDLEPFLAEIASRGIEPAERETYENGVTKVIFRDPDGNEIGVAGKAPVN